MHGILMNKKKKISVCGWVGTIGNLKQVKSVL